MAAYVDFAFYETTYLGTAIASADFPRLALRASEVIDQITFNRAAAIIAESIETATITLIKNATCAVAEQYQANEAGAGGGIQSETVGRYSVTYAKGANVLLSDHEKLVNAAKKYLGSTGLMFPGFLDGEYADECGCDCI